MFQPVEWQTGIKVKTPEFGVIGLYSITPGSIKVKGAADVITSNI